MSWESWEKRLPTNANAELIDNALADARRKSCESRGPRVVIWDEGLPWESREVVTDEDPRWPMAEKFC